MSSKHHEGNEVVTSSDSEETMHQLSVAILNVDKTLSSAKALLSGTLPRTAFIDEAVNLGTRSRTMYILYILLLSPFLTLYLHRLLHSSVCIGLPQPPSPHA